MARQGHAPRVCHKSERVRRARVSLLQLLRHPAQYGHKMRVVDSCQHAGVHKLRGVLHLRPTTDRNPRIVHCHRGWMLVAMVHMPTTMTLRNR